MLSNTIRNIFLFAGLILFMTVAPAHHSFIAQYDPEQPVTLSGTVTRVEWRNPHVYFYLDVENPETGAIESWGVEMGPPHMLQRRGWKKNTVHTGDEITVEGSRARNGSNNANARRVTMAETGVVLGAASSGQTITSGQDENENNEQ